MEAGTLTAAQEEACAGWLRTNRASPLEYAVAKARQHPVLVFGEVHEKKQALEFLNQLIPELHAQAGVRCVAMEVCLAEDNETIQKLVSAPHYDRELALRIARRQPWGVWGFKEYWDVLETVWRVNQTIPAGQKKMRLIGLDSTMDMRSVGIIGLEDNPAKHCPPWEKLRVLRLPRLISVWTLHRPASWRHREPDVEQCRSATRGSSPGHGQDGTPANHSTGPAVASVR